MKTTEQTTTKHDSVAWLKHYREKISPLGEKVSIILGDVFDGIYHVQGQVLNTRTKWHDDYCIEFVVDSLSLQQLKILIDSCTENKATVRVTGAAPNFIRLRFWHK